MHSRRSNQWRVQFKHEGKVRTFGYSATAEEAAWEHDLKRLEDEGHFNRLKLGRA